VRQNASPSQGALPVKSRIYRYLYSSKSFCSRQTIAANCEISMPTLYQNLAQLMDEGLVRSSGEDRSTGGRRAQGLDIIPDIRLAVGVAVTEQNLRLVLADLRLNELAYRTVPFDPSNRSSDDGPALSGILESFLEDYRVDRSKLLGVGIAVPALISKNRERIDFAPTLGMKNTSLAFLTKDIPYPVHVENDGTASGYAEGFLHNVDGNLAYFSLENGVGGAVLIDGVPYIGDDGHTGEFGHLCVEPGGLLCSCGKSGCLEAYCSARRIETNLGVSPDEFFARAGLHNPEYEILLYDMLRHLAIAINNVHMVLDCDVVLGGFLSEYLQPYLPILKQYVLAGNPFVKNADFVRLSTLRRHITPLGAALFFVQEFVNSI
jgi:predicted NBD/HSP70 family sugar kinase